MRRVKHAVRAVSLSVILLCVAGTMAGEVNLMSRSAGRASGGTDWGSTIGSTPGTRSREATAALTVEASAMARVPLAGTEYIPGVTEERALDEIRTLLDQYLENPVDYIPDAARTGA